MLCPIPNLRDILKQMSKHMTYKHWLRIWFASSLLIPHAVACIGQQPTPPPLRVNVLAQSPAETTTDLQIFCLFRSEPANTLHGSLTQINEKLHGLLDQLRQPSLFTGDLGETVLLLPSATDISARRILIIGLGDSATFTPDRMYLVGKIAFREANRLNIGHPIFAPTILDGGVTGFSTDLVAEQVVRGFRDALATESLLQANHAAPPLSVKDFTFLAGVKNVATTQKGIDRALSNASRAYR
jgi:hypothetical protein